MGQQKVETSARAGRSERNRPGDPPRAGHILTAGRELDPSAPSPALALQRRLGEALRAPGRDAEADADAQNETQAWSARRRISFIFLSALCLWIALGLAIRLLIALL